MKRKETKSSLQSAQESPPGPALSEQEVNALVSVLGEPENSDAILRDVMRVSIALNSGASQEGMTAQAKELILAIGAYSTKTHQERVLALQIEMTQRLIARALRQSERTSADNSLAWMNLVFKGCRIAAEQAVALAKLQGKIGRQSMRVEHVHVNEGGQAFVGQHAGGGSEKKPRDLPHAQ
ncbi:MAG: hypothetical protein JNM27_13675 [Leptospirales bacterium]|nr:hypothetical protein [Leptospirales bacterium]